MPFLEGVWIGAEFIIHFFPDTAGILLEEFPMMMDLRAFLQRQQLKRPEEDLVERTHQRHGLYWVRGWARFESPAHRSFATPWHALDIRPGMPLVAASPIICPKASCLENPAPHMPSGHLQLNRNHVRASANRSPSSYSWPKSRRIPFGSRVRGLQPTTVSGSCAASPLPRILAKASS